ncbi:MAG: acyl-CoA thioesterase [Pedobacter sp.]|nr:MAG: acyl-CoA thioesterase [Pedobacter sp.]
MQILNFFKTFWHTNKKTQDKKSEIILSVDHFRYKTSIEIRFKDIDMLGHVNNATYFTYMEVGRTKYWENAIKWDWSKTGVIIGDASIKYFKPIYLKDKLHMYIRTSRIGNSSFDLEYLLVKIENGAEVICSSGKTACITYCYSTKKSIPIPEFEKKKMLAFEQIIG